MAGEDERVVEVLNRLIESCMSGEKGYATAAECVKNHELKTLFHSYSSQRGQYAAELAAEVRRRGGAPYEHNGVVAALWRGWTNLKSAVTGGDEHAVITECERGEGTALETYEGALREPLPADLQAVVQRQFAGVKEAHERIRALETAAAKL